MGQNTEKYTCIIKKSFSVHFNMEFVKKNTIRGGGGVTLDGKCLALRMRRMMVMLMPVGMV